MHRGIIVAALLVSLCTLGALLVQSQTANLVGTVSVESGSIEIKRAETDAWVKLTRESLIGVGDTLRTQADSTAVLAFLTDQVRVTMKAQSELVIAQLQQQDNLVLVTIQQKDGEVTHAVKPAGDIPITLEARTDKLGAFSQNGAFTLSVASDGSHYLLGVEGDSVVRGGGRVETVTAGTGARVDKDNTLSAVLPAPSIEKLASAIDGVTAKVATEIDGLLNVRKAPSRTASVLGQVDVSGIKTLLGISRNGQWYRISFGKVAGWISSVGLIVEVERDLLAVFEMDYVEADPVTVNAAVALAPAPTPAPAPSQAGSGYNILSEYSESQLTMLALLNEWRQSVNLAPFKLNPLLTKMAEDQARYVLSFPSLPSDIHRDANGTYPMERALDKKYNWPFFGMAARMAIGENTYAGRNEAAAVAWWKGSTVHRNTTENPGYREVGIASLPHTYGKLFVIVFGARPDILPVLIDPQTKTMYLTTEQYRFSDSGNWMKQVQEYQILDTPLSQIDDANWKPFSGSVPAPDKPAFSIALRGNGKVLVQQVDVAQNTAWFPTNTSLATGQASGGGSPAVFATSTPRP